MNIHFVPWVRVNLNKRISRLAVILLISVALRISAALYLGGQLEGFPGTADQVSYHKLALRLLDGHGFTFGSTWWPDTAAGAPTAHWSYFYTLFLVAVYAIFGTHPLVARLLQAVIVGLLQPYLAYRIGCHTFNKAIGLLAAALTAFYSYFIYYTASLMTEPFYISAILASLYLAMLMTDQRSSLTEFESNTGSRRQAVALGFTIGIAILLRQLFLLFLPFLFFWIWKTSRGHVIKRLVPTSGIILILILPFTVYNYIRFGRFVLLNTNAGFAFFWANHPVYGTHFESILPPEMGSYQDLIPSELRNLDEAALDQALLSRGIKYVAEDPGRFVLLSLSRIPAYFKFWPSAESNLISNVVRVASFGLLLPLMLYGLVRSFLDRSFLSSHGNSSGVILLYLFVGIYTTIHLLSWALIRYRLPVDAVLVIFAGLGLADLTSRIKSLRRPAASQV